MRKRRTIVERQRHGHLTFWQRLILVNAMLLSGAIVADMIPSQTVHAINCVAGHGGHGGIANDGQNGASGTFPGDCVIGGNKDLSIGGFNQNNGVQRASQVNGGDNVP